MNAIEPIADAITGASLARAVEPASGSDQGGHTSERACLNCNATLVGAFCHACGQKGHVHRTLSAFAHDLLHGVLHFEGKIFRTLPMLLLKPGEITRRYIAGERARFVSPLALFLFSVFTMFAVISLLGSPMDMVESEGREEFNTELHREIGEFDGRIQALRAQRTEALERRSGTAALDRKIRDLESGRQIVSALAGTIPADSASYKAGLAAGARMEGGAASAAAPSLQRTNSGPGADINNLKVQVGDPGSKLDQAYRAAKQNPKLLIYKLQTNAYKFSWALIVLSVPFMALLFLWRWRPLYDHAVFVTYSITAVSMLVILGSVLFLAGVPAGAIIVSILLFVPWHMYRQLRGGYGLRRFSALWRTAALAFFANFALSLFAFGLLMLGVLG